MIDKKLQLTAYDTLMDMSRLPDYLIELDGDIDLVPDECDLDSYKRLAEIEDDIRPRTLSNKIFGRDKHLMICSSNTGNGKTSWAMKLIMEYCWRDSQFEYCPIHSEYHRAVFLSCTEVLTSYKEWNDIRRKRYWGMEDDARQASLVVFDDVGSLECTKAEYALLYALIDYRLFQNKMCIFTSNFTQKDEKATVRLGQRLADRIFDNSEIIELKGIGVRH